MEKRGQQNKQKDKTTAVLVWLLAILVMAGIVAGGLYAREYLHRSFLAVAVEQPDPKRNEHVVRVTPSPRTQDRTAAPVETTPTQSLERGRDRHGHALPHRFGHPNPAHEPGIPGL